MLRCVYHYRILFVVRGRKIFPLELPFPPSFFFLFLRSCPLPYLRRWRTNGSVNRSFAYRSIRSFLAIVQRKRYGFKSVNRLLLESCHTRFDASRFSRPRQFSSLFSFLLCFVFFFCFLFFVPRRIATTARERLRRRSVALSSKSLDRKFTNGAAKRLDK